MTFVQGPEIWLNQLGIEVPCVVDPARMATLDEAHRVFVNYETYYLADAAALASFGQAPWQYCGLLTDPVSGERFQPTAESPRHDHGNRQFYFASKGNFDTFVGDPAAYATPVVPYAGHM